MLTWFVPVVMCAAMNAEPKAADVELIAAWVLGRDPQQVFPDEFGDSGYLTAAKDALVYTDVPGVKFPQGLKPVPYDFIQERVLQVGYGEKVDPAVIITASILADPPERAGGARELRDEYRELLPGERCYHVEVRIGNMGSHWMKLTVREVDGKPKVEIHRVAVS